jgi:hypothetical protein
MGSVLKLRQPEPARQAAIGGGAAISHTAEPKLCPMTGAASLRGALAPKQSACNARIAWIATAARGCLATADMAGHKFIFSPGGIRRRQDALPSSHKRR